MIKKLIFIFIIALVFLGLFFVVKTVTGSPNDLQPSKAHTPLQIVNPATGEKWDSVEEFRFRNSKEVKDADSLQS